MCVKDTGTKYQLWISDFNIDGTFTRVHPFIISHTKTMTRTREDGKEEVFSACIKPDDTRYLGGNKSSSVVATKLRGTVVRSSWLINLFSVFVFLDTTPATVYYNIKYNKLKT